MTCSEYGEHLLYEPLEQVHEASVHHILQLAAFVRKENYVAPTINACCIEPAEQAAVTRIYLSPQKLIARATLQLLPS